MRTITRNDGFTLTELLVSTTITLLLLAAAMTTVKNALTLNDTGTQLADANQNLRAGTNLLIRDLLQAGRTITVGGIPIPNGTGSTVINRPSPPGTSTTFDNITMTTLPAITTGQAKGPTVDNQSTDTITILMIDPFDCVSIAAGAILADASSVTLGSSSPWITGANAVAPCDKAAATKAGDLIWFNSGNGALRTVTSVDSSKAYFAASDWFNFNQSAAANGTVLKLKVAGAFPAMTLYRLTMLTYYVDATTTPGTPRLTKMQNHFLPAQPLAGVVEDLDFTYDLVDGATNPVNVVSLPYTLAGLTYNANQIRKVNLHIGVRSDLYSSVKHDYIRNHITTSVSLRDLASISRYF